MLYPDSEARLQLAREYQALLAQEARTVRREKAFAAKPDPRRRRRVSIRRPRLAT